jgi:hypothetical protein
MHSITALIQYDPRAAVNDEKPMVRACKNNHEKINRINVLLIIQSRFTALVIVNVDATIVNDVSYFLLLVVVLMHKTMFFVCSLITFVWFSLFFVSF